MLPDYIWFLIAGSLLLLTLLLLLFAAGRRLLRASLPAAAFFLLLGGAAGAGYWLGVKQAAQDTRIYTCGMHKQVHHVGPGLCPICHMDLVLESADTDQGPAVTIDPVVVQNMGVRLAEVSRGPLQQHVRAFGVLRAAEPRQRDIALKFSGFVEKLHADTEGMVIRAGDPLFELYSADLQVAQAELIASKQSGDAGLLAAARQKLLLWDVPAEIVDELQAQDRARRTLVWKSPVAGILVRRDVVAGAPAMTNQTLLRIVDLSVLWLDAQVPEHQLAFVHAGQEATATFPAAPGTEVTGRVIFIAPSLDATSRTVAVRVETPNPDGNLKPGMFARLQLRVAPVADAVLVPLEAVIDTGVRQLAWVALGKGRFEPRELRVGPTGDGGVVQILSGLEPGDPVVVSGQFLIDAESRLREGARKLHDRGLMPGGDLTPSAAAELSQPTQQRIDALLDAYLKVAADLAGDRNEAADLQALADAASMVAAAPEQALQRPAGEMAAALTQPAPADLVAARVLFKVVSAAAERLFAVARPTGATGGKLYVQHCPMAEADWLQLEARVKNPYYGRAMLDCGTVRRELPLRARGTGR